MHFPILPRNLPFKSFRREVTVASWEYEVDRGLYIIVVLLISLFPPCQIIIIIIFTYLFICFRGCRGLNSVPLS